MGRGHLFAHQCEKQRAPLLGPVFFSPLAINVVVCVKFNTRKEGRTTMCHYSPRRRRKRGQGQGREGGGRGGKKEVKMKRRRKRRRKKEKKKRE